MIVFISYRFFSDSHLFLSVFSLNRLAKMKENKSTQSMSIRFESSENLSILHLMCGKVRLANEYL